MSNAVEVIHPDFPNQPSAVAPAPQPNAVVTPMMMLASAVERGADIATIERLAGLYERMETHRARKEFDEAIAGFKAECPPILKGREIRHNGKLISRYEDMAAISRAIDPVLAKFGLSYRFRTDALDKAVRVTCVISHRAGHSEETSLTGPHDMTGAKNAIQGIGSSVTYLQRYTLKAALGLAVSEDDDGGSPEQAGDTVTMEQAQEIEDLIIDTGGEVSAFLQFKRLSSVSAIKAKDFAATISEIKRIAAKRAEKRNG